MLFIKWRPREGKYLKDVSVNEYEDETYTFTSSVVSVNIRSDHNAKDSKNIVGSLKNGETYNYIKKYNDGNHVWGSNGKTWLAVREVKNGERQPLWGKLHEQKQEVKPTKEYIQLDKSRTSWSVYPLVKPLVYGNAIGQLNPSLFGGLEYEVLGRPVASAVTIQTRDWGKVNIYVGSDVSQWYKIVKK